MDFENDYINATMYLENYNYDYDNNNKNNMNIEELFSPQKINFYSKIKPINLENINNSYLEITNYINNKFNSGQLSQQVISNFISVNNKKKLKDLKFLKYTDTDFDKLIVNTNNILNDNFSGDNFINLFLNFIASITKKLIDEISVYSNSYTNNKMQLSNDTTSTFSFNSISLTNYNQNSKRKWDENEITTIEKKLKKYNNNIPHSEIYKICHLFNRSKNSVLSKINKLKKSRKSISNYNLEDYDFFKVNNNIICQIVKIKFGVDEFNNRNGLFESSIFECLDFQNIKYDIQAVNKEIEVIKSSNIFKFENIRQYKMNPNYHFKHSIPEEFSIKDFIYNIYKNNNNSYITFNYLLQKLVLNFEYSEDDIKYDLKYFLENDKNIIFFDDIFFYIDNWI